jgi:hypothetical protein
MWRAGSRGKVKGKETFDQERHPMPACGWMESCFNLMQGMPERILPMREVNHHIPLVDENTKYNYHPSKCLDSMRKLLTEKIEQYCRAGWWWPAEAEQAVPMLVVPKKSGNMRTVMNAKKCNDIMIKDVTPFPDQDLMRLDVAQAPYHSKIDLSGTYKQVPIEPEEVWKMVFTTIYGIWEPGDAAGQLQCAINLQKDDELYIPRIYWNLHPHLLGWHICVQQ